MKSALITLLIAGVANLSFGDVSHIANSEYGKYELQYESTTTEPSPPNPYKFSYAAGRFPGHVDRIQKESGDGIGHVRGSYSYIDPKQKVRTVKYTVDENGFHPKLINYEDVLQQPTDSEAVRLAKERHHSLYQRIAANNAQGVAALPKDSLSVARAKDRHLTLFQKISAEHAAIAAQREAERLTFEATSVPNDVSSHY